MSMKMANSTESETSPMSAQLNMHDEGELQALFEQYKSEECEERWRHLFNGWHSTSR